MKRGITRILTLVRRFHWSRPRLAVVCHQPSLSMNVHSYPGKDLSLSQLAFALNEELKRTAYSPTYVAKHSRWTPLKDLE